MSLNNRNRPEADFSLVDTLLSPYRSARDWFADALSGDDSIRDPDGGPLSTLVSILTLPFRLLFAFMVFMVQAWTTSRSGRAFLLGMPAVGVMALCALIAWGVTFYKSYNRLPILRANMFYQAQAKAENPVPENLLMSAKKLLVLKPDNEQYRYNVGVALAAMKDESNAVSLMKVLAPEDEVGFIPAHLWLARNYLRKEIQNEEMGDADSLVSKHLNLVASAEPTNLDAQSSLASQYQIRAAKAEKAGDEEGKKANLEKAEEALENIIEPVVNGKRRAASSYGQVMQIPRLLNIKRQLGTEKGAMQRYDDTFKTFVEETQDWPSEYRQKIFTAFRDSAISVKDYDRAVDVMQLAFQTFDDSRLKQTYVRNSAKIMLMKASENKNFEDREEFLAHMDALCKSFNASPKEREAYMLLLNVIRETNKSDDCLKWLNESLLDSPKLSLTHLLIGFNLISQGDIQDGRNHWKIAFRMEKIAQNILNNIIDVASADKERRIENMIDVNLIALEMFDHPMLYQSMGINYMRQENYVEAAKNFEIAIEQNEMLVTSHFHLIKIYDALGNTEKKDYHQGKLDEYLNKLPHEQAKRFLAILETL